MKHAEQKAKSASKSKVGIFAVLSRFFDLKGTSLPPSRANSSSSFAVRSQTTTKPSSRRLRATLAVLALAIAALAATAAPASAAIEMESVSEVSYATAKATGKVLTNAEGFGASYTFEYSTSESGPWNPGPSVFVGNGTPKPAQIEGRFENLHGATQYFVRLSGNGSSSPTATPYPSFTTLTADPPSVEQADNASEVEYTQVKVTGKVNRPAKSNDLTCNFEYITPADFAVQRDELQELTVAAEGGTFSLGFDGQTTAPIAFDASAATVQDELEALSSVPAAGLTVSGGPGGAAPFTIAFEGALGNRNVPLLLSDGSNLTGSEAAPASIAATTITEGRSEGYEGATKAPCETANSGETSGTIQAPGSSDVSAKLGGLTLATTYKLRLAVSNAAAEVTKDAADFTTLATVPAPTANRIDDASEVEYSRASLSGEVSRPDGADPILNTECNFEYITDTAYLANPAGERFSGAAPVPCEEPNSVIEASGPAEVTAKLIGLDADTIYHLRLSVTNAGGIGSKEAADTFTTLGPVPKPVIIETGEAAEVGKRSAQASGRVERPAGPEGTDPAFDVNCRFEYITDAQFTANPPGEGFTGATPVGCGPENPITSPDPGHPALTAEVSAELTGLEPGTTYHLRLAAENGGGVVTKDAPSTFTTVALIHPALTVDSITEVGYTSFTVTGTADPGNQGVWPGFEHSPVGTEEWAGNDFSQFRDLAADSPAQERSFHFPCGETAGNGDFCTPPLKPGTTYQVRMYGYENETTGGAGGEFFTSPAPYPEVTTKGTSTPPSASCDPATEVTGTSAHLSCLVDTHAPAEPLNDEGNAAYRTDWHFECTPACPVLPSDTVEANEGSQSIEVEVKHLETNTHYQIKLVAHNALATVESEQTVDTPRIAPTVKALPGGSDGEGGYSLAGIVNPNQSQVTACEFKWGPNSASYAFTAPCSPPPGKGGQPVTVEAHLSGLNPGAVYHADLVIKSADFGEDDSGDFEFTPTLATKGSECPNEQPRKENGSLGLPECRAYEMVTDPNKEGNSATIRDFARGDAVAYASGASNLAGSGQGRIAQPNQYVSTRTVAGWKTIPGLNGPSGSMQAAPEYLEAEEKSVWPAVTYSADLLSSIWALGKKDSPEGPYLRQPDGRFALIGIGSVLLPSTVARATVQASEDLSHLVLSSEEPSYPTTWGPGIYEFLGTGNTQPPRRVDVDNSGSPIGSCGAVNSFGSTISTDGRAIVFSVRGCAGPNPPVTEIWARVDATTSYDISASDCHRPAADPCNAPADATFRGSAKDGSRVYFTTTQQLVNGDTDQTNDLYACDLPAGPQAPVGAANPCSALHQVSAPSTGKAEVQRVIKISDDGSTAYFIARGVLAANEDGLGEAALPGDRNLYVWRTDAAHTAGRIAFLARLPESDSPVAQTTPDGRYALLQTAGQLLPTDTDESADIYRYDADNEELTRISTAVSGAGGNGDFDARLGTAIDPILLTPQSRTSLNSHPSISDNGQLIVFATEEALSPLDGNDEPDAYLWNGGQVRGSVAPLAPSLGYTGEKLPGQVFIDGSGQDIYIQTAARLTPTDTDTQTDVYDARIGGGFPQRQEGCAGDAGACQSQSPQPAPAPTPGTALPPADPGNVVPKHCRKGKILKGDRCVKKPHKKHSAKKHHSKKHKRANSNSGGGK